MSLRGKRASDITEVDLINLIGLEESQILDFKRKAESDRDEFLADVTSFANAIGGHIIYGMEEEDRKATRLCGIGSIDIDTKIGRLQSWINDCVEPRIHGWDIDSVDLQNPASGLAIVVSMPRSFATPHRVRPTRKFYKRYPNGKQEMSMDEIRAAFNLSEGLVARVKGFRKRRIEMLSGDDVHEEVPVLLVPGPRLVLHVVPLAAFDLGTAIDLTQLASPDTRNEWVSNFHQYLDRIGLGHVRFNLDGVVTSINHNEQGEQSRYIQVLRNGSIEFVCDLSELIVSNIFRYVRMKPPQDEDLAIGIDTLEKYALHGLRNALYCQANLGVDLPLVVMLSILNAKEYSIGQLPKKFGRNQILLPDTIITDYNQDSVDIMKPIFDILYNMAGFPLSSSYDADGNWVNNQYPDWKQKN